MTLAKAGLFRGSLSALPTPFTGAQIDFRALHKLIRRQIEGGTDGLVLAGSTGESASLTRDERLAILEFTVGATRGRVPVIAGLGAGNTRSTCELAEAATGLGVAGLMVTPPAYSRPSERGLAAHIGTLARSTELPILLYNIPSRTGVDLATETVVELAAAHNNVLGIKESSSLARLGELIERLDIDVLCGDDRWIVDAMELGCAGIVSVVSNLVPEKVSRLVHAFDSDGDPAEALAEAESVTALATILSIDSNPGPLKAACEMLRLCRGGLRLPLIPVTDENRDRIRAALRDVGLV